MRFCKGVKSFKRGIDLSPKLSVSLKSPKNNKLPKCSHFSHVYINESRARRIHKLIEKGQRAASDLVAVSLELELAGYKPVSSSRSKRRDRNRGVLVLQ
jgi:hypothetical protein